MTTGYLECWNEWDRKRAKCKQRNAYTTTRQYFQLWALGATRPSPDRFFPSDEDFGARHVGDLHPRFRKSPDGSAPLSLLFAREHCLFRCTTVWSRDYQTETFRYQCGSACFAVGARETYLPSEIPRVSQFLRCNNAIQKHGASRDMFIVLE